MSRFLSDRFATLTPYTPGEQPRDQQYIKLNTNESPFPPSPRVLSAVNSDEVKKLNLYPDPTASELVKKLAEHYGVEKKNVFVSIQKTCIKLHFFILFILKKRRRNI